MDNNPINLLQLSLRGVVLGVMLFVAGVGLRSGDTATPVTFEGNVVSTIQEVYLSASVIAPSRISTPTATVRLEPPVSSVQVGQVFTVTLTATNIRDLGSYQFWLYFDPSALTVEQIRDGGFLGSTGRPVTTNEHPGDNFVFFEAWSTGSRHGPSSEEAVLAYIAIRSQQVGRSDLDLRDVVLRSPAGDLQVVEEEDGSVEVRPSLRYLPMVGKNYCTPDHFEPNNSFAEARQLTAGTRIEANICPVTDVWDVYYIEVTALDTIAVELTDMSSGTNFDIFLHDEDRTLVDWSTKEGNVDERIEYTPQKTGRYYIVVYQNPEVTPNVGPYKLQATFGGDS